jgi:Amidohydrolase
MPVQKFAPMTKEFPSFDCDAHVTEPPWLWERAKDYLTKDEFEALKGSFWFDPESNRVIANGLGYAGPASLFHGTAGMVNVLSLAGPGVNHNIQRALNVRNLQRKNPITKEQADYLDHKGSYLPEPRLRDMDIQGIDQVMIIPTDFEAYPWIQNAAGARAMCKAYNDWAYEYCQADPERLYFAALLPMQDAKFAEQELYRVAGKGCRVGLIRPIDALGNYPIQPKYGRVWRAM